MLVIITGSVFKLRRFVINATTPIRLLVDLRQLSADPVLIPFVRRARIIQIGREVTRIGSQGN
jgi:hypothetical protein